MWFILFAIFFFFFFKQKTAYEIMPSLVGSEMCIRDSSPPPRPVDLETQKNLPRGRLRARSRRAILTRPSFSTTYRRGQGLSRLGPVSYTHLRAHETRHDLVCRLLLEKKKKKK